MYIDLILVVVLIIVAFAWFRRFSKIVYSVAIIDLFLRLIYYISKNIGIKGFYRWVKHVFPSSIPDMLANYMKGTVLAVFTWIYVGLMVAFLFYTVRSFIRKK